MVPRAKSIQNPKDFRVIDFAVDGSVQVFLREGSCAETTMGNQKCEIDVCFGFCGNYLMQAKGFTISWSSTGTTREVVMVCLFGFVEGLRGRIHRNVLLTHASQRVCNKFGFHGNY